MSTNYYYNTSEEINIRKRTAGKIEKGVKRLLIIAAVILAAQLIWLFGISPFIPFSTVEVHGFSPLSRTEILSLAGIDENASFFSTNVRKIQNVLSSHILVESALVMKRFPDRLLIFLNPRTASALVLANDNFKQSPLYVDRHGVFYKIGDPSSAETLNLPVLSGIENPQLGMRFPSALVPLVESLSQIAITSPELLSAISEIHIEPKTWDGYELLLYPVHSSIRVRMENNLTEDTLRYMLLMLNVFENDIQKPQEIDFRSGMGTYRIKEQS
ncbi:MAG: FtsQ-type POTRA domain-containing protein [Treponema sp.]|nr:FtsQ-type POTRA domain-containing protein [Treponema sp.]